MRHFLLTLVLGLGVVVPCQAGWFTKNCSAKACAQCGCCQLKKVCRIVPDVKKVTENKYTVEEEEVCLLGKSCTEERIVEDECGCQRCEQVQTPRCGRIVCKKKLKKTTTTVEKPIAKCVMDIVCCQCGAVCDQTPCVP